MSGPRRLYEVLKDWSSAQAQWDYEVSTSIIRDRKRFLIVLLLCAPIPLLATAHAAPLLGGSSAYGPTYYSGTLFALAIVIGVIAGLITGCIGAGGGFVSTPALMSIGVRGIMAVGTDLFHIFAKSIMGTAVHRKLGNVSAALAIPFMVGSFFGVYAGGTLNRAIYAINPILSNIFISAVYAVVLGFLGTYAMWDFLKHRGGPAANGGARAYTATGMTKLAVTCQSLKIPPMLKFDEDFVPGGKRISWVMLTAGGYVVGVLSAMMGVGGGFATFPMYVYAFGVSSATSVGTDIFQIIFTAGLGSITQYAVYGYVFYSVAMGMLLGSLIGIQVGALTTKVVKGIHIRGFFAVSILAGFVNRLFALPAQMQQVGLIHVDRSFVAGVQHLGDLVFWGVCSVFAVWVFIKFATSMNILREEPTTARDVPLRRTS